MPSKKLLRSLIFVSQHQSKQKLPTQSCQSCTFSFEYFYASGFFEMLTTKFFFNNIWLGFFWKNRHQLRRGQEAFLFHTRSGGWRVEFASSTGNAAQLGENWFFVCFSGPKWHLTGDHCMNNPQLTPHFLRGSNDARSYPKKTSICQRWFKFIQKFQGIQKSNIFARK